MKEANKQQWFKFFKPFGWEVLDIRYGGLMSRLESVSDRLIDFCTGKIPVIEELDEEIIPFSPPAQIKSGGYIEDFHNVYARIVTANKI